MVYSALWYWPVITLRHSGWYITTPNRGILADILQLDIFYFLRITINVLIPKKVSHVSTLHMYTRFDNMMERVEGKMVNWWNRLSQKLTIDVLFSGSSNQYCLDIVKTMTHQLDNFPLHSTINEVKSNEDAR